MNAPARPTRAALLGLLIGLAAGVLAASGPLLSATVITIGVETQVGTATGLPTAFMLPASLEGLGAVALAYIITLRPTGGMRWWCVLLIGATLGAGMAAQGSHALWYDEATHGLVLPWGVKLFVSFVPPVSGAAALHLVVLMAERFIATVRQLHALPADGSDAPRDDVALEPSQPTGGAGQEPDGNQPALPSGMAAADDVRAGRDRHADHVRPADDFAADDVRNPHERRPARDEVRRQLRRHRGALTSVELSRLAVRVAERTGVSIPRVRRLLLEEQQLRVVTEPPQVPVAEREAEA